MRIRSILIAVVASASFAASVAQTVDGAAATPADEGEPALVLLDAAHLTKPIFGFWEWVELRAIDGAPVKTDRTDARQYILSPGLHELTVRYVYDNGGAEGLLEGLLRRSLTERLTARFEQKLPLEALAGHTYRVRYQNDTKFGGVPASAEQVRYWVEDVTPTAPAAEKP